MLNVNEAQLIIKNHLPAWTGYGIALDEPLIADRDYPPIHRVMMDGIAIHFSAYEKGLRKFQIAGTCFAGAEAQKLHHEAECLEVMTGAPLPFAANLIIPYEHLTIENSLAEIVVEQERHPMDHVHLMGSDYKKGDTLLPQGATRNGPHWGIASSLGYASPRLRKQPKIHIISTGDELVPVSETPLPFQVRRSNVSALQMSLQTYGFHDIALSHLPDKEKEIEDHFHAHVKEVDLMFYSGGVSMGKKDLLPKLWRQLGVTQHFHGVSQKPGKPLWFGTHESHKTAVIGLPGNPISSLICLHRYFLSRKEVYAIIKPAFRGHKSLTTYIPAKLQFTKEGQLTAHPLEMKNSGEFSALAESDGFLEVPPSSEEFKPGNTFLFHPWSPL